MRVGDAPHSVANIPTYEILDKTLSQPPFDIMCQAAHGRHKTAINLNSGHTHCIVHSYSAFSCVLSTC